MKSKVIAGTTAAVLALTTTFAVSADSAKYPNDYTIENILSDYNIFVSGDFKTSSHIAGSIAAGGTLEVGAFGDASVIPSYAHVLNYNSYNNGGWLDESIRSNIVYYGSSSSNVSGNNFIENDNYIDFATAMDKISEQSKLIAKNAEAVKNSDYDESSKKLTIDLTNYKSKSIVMPYELFDKAEIIDFTGVDLKTFATGGYTISVTGGDRATISFGYTSWGSGKHVLLNDQGLDNAFKTLAGSHQGGQYNISGTNLMFNFPNATNIDLNMLAGSIVAPTANVYVAGGNFEGNIIAASAGTQGEGHFYSYYPHGTRNKYSDVGLDSEPSESASSTTTTKPKDTTTTTTTTKPKDTTTTTTTTKPKDTTTTTTTTKPKDTTTTTTTTKPKDTTTTTTTTKPKDTTTTTTTTKPKDTTTTTTTTKPKDTTTTTTTTKLKDTTTTTTTTKPKDTTTTTTTTKPKDTTTTTTNDTITTEPTTTTTPAPTTSETETPEPTTTTTPATTEPTTTPPATTTSEVTTTTPTTTTTGSNGDDDDEDQPTETTTTTGPNGDDGDETETTTTTKPSDVADETGTGTTKTTTSSKPEEGHDDEGSNDDGNGDDDGKVGSGNGTKTTTESSTPSESTDDHTGTFTSDNPSTGMGAYASMSVASLLTVAAAMFIGKKKFSDKK